MDIATTIPNRPSGSIGENGPSLNGYSHRVDVWVGSCNYTVSYQASLLHRHNVIAQSPHSLLCGSPVITQSPMWQPSLHTVPHVAAQSLHSPPCGSPVSSLHSTILGHNRAVMGGGPTPKIPWRSGAIREREDMIRGRRGQGEGVGRQIGSANEQVGASKWFDIATDLSPLFLFRKE